MAKILVIEDELSVQDVLMDILALHNHTVECCDTVEAGVKAYMSLNPDVVITDWTLPDGSGEEVIDHILREGGRGKVIVSTGNNPQQIEEILASREGLSSAIVTKPFKLQDIVEAVALFVN
jgi:two-component system response regulator HydG